MRAAVLRNVGDEKVEVRDDVTVADPGPGEVLVKIHATTVNRSDVHTREANRSSGLVLFARCGGVKLHA